MKIRVRQYTYVCILQPYERTCIYYRENRKRTNENAESEIEKCNECKVEKNRRDAILTGKSGRKAKIYIFM